MSERASVAFSLVRVDDRLVHGQVLLNWVRLLRPRRIAVVDDKLLADAVARAVIELVLPDAVALWVGRLEDAARALLADEACPPSATLVLVRSPADAVALHDAGVPFASLNLGCLACTPGRLRVRRQLYLSPGEVASLRTLTRRGVHVTAQAVPADRALSLEEIECRLSRSLSHSP